MNEWIDIASKFGIPVFFLIAICLFLLKQVWPRFKRQMEDADKERIENAARLVEQGRMFTDALKAEREYNAKRFEDQGKLFMDSLRQQNVLTADTHKEITRELRAISALLRGK